MAEQRFNHHQPANLETLLDLMARFRTDVLIMAGGTELVPAMREGRLTTANVVSIGRVGGLSHISYYDSDGLVIGAASKVAEVAAHPDVRRHYPALAQACAQMATPQVRNMATVAGNLAGASPAADCAAPLLVHGASLVLVERGGRRQAPLAKFFTGPGQTVREPMEVIEAIRVPAPPKRCGSCYLRLTPTGRADRLALGLAGLLSLDAAGNIIRARLAISAAGPTPLRAVEAENMLEGMPPEQGLLARAAAACVRAVSPVDDHLASAFYRRMMTQVLARRVLASCLELARRDDR